MSATPSDMPNPKELTQADYKRLYEQERAQARKWENEAKRHSEELRAAEKSHAELREQKTQIEQRTRELEAEYEHEQAHTRRLALQLDYGISDDDAADFFTGDPERDERVAKKLALRNRHHEAQQDRSRQHADEATLRRQNAALQDFVSGDRSSQTPYWTGSFGGAQALAQTRPENTIDRTVRERREAH